MTSLITLAGIAALLIVFGTALKVAAHRRRTTIRLAASPDRRCTTCERTFEDCQCTYTTGGEA